MWGKIAGGTVALVVFSNLAHAGVSDDLLFCSKLGSPKERVSCYDAAARIAANAQNQPTPRRAVPTLEARPARAAPEPFVAPSPVNRFQGVHALVYGGIIPSTSDGSSDFSKISAKTLGFGVGYDFALGNFVVGVEARGHWDRGSLTNYTGSLNVVNLPVLYSTYFGSPPSFPITGDYTVGYSQSSTQFYERKAGGDVSWRLGYTPTDWLLIFGRLGGGLQQFRYTSTYSFQNISCQNVTTSTVQRPNSQVYDVFVVGCGNVAITGTPTTTILETTIPYVVAGTGFEAAFDRFFVRIEGEISAYLKHPQGFTTTNLYSVAGNVGVGVRF